MTQLDAVVIGGGQAGLAAGYHLQQAGLGFVILEASDEATGSWKRYYDSLRLFSPARYSSLPGMPFPGNPDRYPTRDEVVDYLRVYAAHFQLPILTNAFVDHAEFRDGMFHISTRQQGQFTGKALIAATGAFTRPHIPQFEGQALYAGTLLHSASYVNPEPFHNQRVLVVGAGNSAVQIATELAQAAQVTLTSREPVQFTPQRILGKDIHFWITITGYDSWKRQFPQWNPAAIKKVGVLDTGIYRAALASGNPRFMPLFDRFTPAGVQWANGAEEAFDSVIFATGFQPNFPYLQSLNALDEVGNALHQSGISTTVPGLYYVGISGQRSFASATLRGVGDDAAYAVRHLKQSLKPAASQQGARCCFNLQTT